MGKRQGSTSAVAAAGSAGDRLRREAERERQLPTSRTRSGGREQEQQQAGRPAAGKRKRKDEEPDAEPEDTLLAGQEEKAEQPSKRGRGSGARKQTQGKNHQAALAEALSPPPSAGQRQQQRPGRSPTPVAAAPPLEMSAPPASAGKAAGAAAAGQQQQQQQQMQKLWAHEQAPAAAVPAQEGNGAEAGVGASASSADAAAAAQDWLLRRLSQPRSKEAATMQLRPRLQEALESLFDSLTNTVELGHNNSLLVVGPRGCGKTLVTERALAALQSRFNKDPRDPVVGVVRLSGLSHGEERAAFREIARQLCEVFQYSFSKAASVGENIEFLRGMLGALASCDKSVVFVLDDFDLFAGKRSKQTLLYNLLDALQTSGMRAAVLGLTCRQDVVEMLEKRVKSRFSHRKVDLSLPTSVLPVVPSSREGGGSPKGVQVAQDGALDVLKAMLSLPPEFPYTTWVQRWNASVETVCSGSSSSSSSAGARAGASAASGSTASLSCPLRSALQRCINIYPSLRHLANIADVAMASCLGSSPGSSSGAGGSSKGKGEPSGSGRCHLSEAALLAAVERQLSHAKAMVNLISGLPILDLALLVAAHRVTAKGQEDLNFEMVHHEFKCYAVSASHVDTYTRAAAAAAWDHLMSAGLVAFVDPRSEARAGARCYAAAYLLVTREEVEEGLGAHWNCPHALAEWFKREAGLGTTAAQFL